MPIIRWCRYHWANLTLRQTCGLAIGLMMLLNGWQVARAATTRPPATSSHASYSLTVDGRLTTLSFDHSLSTAPVTPSDAAATTLRAAGLSAEFTQLYLDAAAATGTPWQLLAAVHYAETRQSGSTSRQSPAGAVGPMQFLPATFAVYGLDADHNGRRDITNVTDAVYSAGRYLAANGAARGQYIAALLVYNHSDSYASSVLATARRLGLN
ncbi:MAG TPA: lytic transglycosylase domain-containing protein [Candidatus Saccharimonadia bacterium]